jgi:hypothetical protein
MTKPLPPGRVLLNKLLTPAQRADLDIRGSFIERGVEITIHKNAVGDPRFVSVAGCICINGATLPVWDQAIAYLLFIRADFTGFSRTVNHEMIWPKPSRPGEQRFGYSQ